MTEYKGGSHPNPGEQIGYIADGRNVSGHFFKGGVHAVGSGTAENPVVLWETVNTSGIERGGELQPGDEVKFPDGTVIRNPGANQLETTPA